MENLATQLADLFSAIQCSDEKQIKRLLAANVSPYQQNKAGTTALMVAAQIGNSKIMQMLCGAAKGIPQPAPLFFSPVVSFNEEPTAINSVMATAPFRSAPTPISGRSAVMLVETSRTDTFSNHTVPPTTVMSIAGMPEISTPASTMHTNLSSPETTAAANNPDDTEATLPNPNKNSNKHSNTSKQLTIQQSEKALVQVSTDASAYKQEALKEAIIRNDSDTVKDLLSSGVNVQAANWYDTPLLVLAAQRGNNDIVQALIKAGAHVNRGYDRLPLNIAAEYGHFEVVHTLMRSGAYLEGQEESGYTALMCAAAAGQLLIVQVLVDCGADVDANYYGKTPLMLAARNGHKEIYHFLYPYARSQGMMMTEQVLQQRAVLASKRKQLDNEVSAIFDPNRTPADIPQ